HQLSEQRAISQSLQLHTRNTEMFDYKVIKAKARQQREALEAEYGQALPRRKHRIKHPHATEDARWVDHVASSIINTTLPTDPDVIEAQQQAHQASEDAQHATER